MTKMRFNWITRQLIRNSERSLHHLLDLVNARILKKIMRKSLLVADIFLKEPWRLRFSRLFFHCFTTNKLIFLFDGLESWIGDFFIVCRIPRAFFIVQTVWQNSKWLLRYFPWNLDEFNDDILSFFISLQPRFKFIKKSCSSVIFTGKPGGGNKCCCWYWKGTGFKN